MKNLIFILFLLVSLSSYSQKSDTTVIKNDSLEYQIIIVDPMFNTWLIGNARPSGYYRIGYLETHNKYSVADWNVKFLSSNNKDIYQFYIDYDPNVRYGYEVNYLLFNYFQYFRNKTKENIGIRAR